MVFAVTFRVSALNLSKAMELLMLVGTCCAQCDVCAVESGSEGSSLIQMHPVSGAVPFVKSTSAGLPLLQIDQERTGVRQQAILDPRSGEERFHRLPTSILQAFEDAAAQQRLKLVFGAQPGAAPQNPKEEGKASVFEAVSVSLPIAPPILDHNPNNDSGDFEEIPKNVAATQELAKLGNKCVVYGLGIATNSAFESKMADLGCETHAFDCSISSKSPAVNGKSFTFHPWCIGKKGNTSFDGNAYVGGQSVEELQFKSLSETMKLLGHSHISLLKFDIEGFEWGLFENEILKSLQLPGQLAFELHTEGANPRYVPEENTKGKDYVAVNRLFLELHDKGYRVVSKELNSGDHACAEFVLVNVLQ